MDSPAGRSHPGCPMTTNPLHFARQCPAPLWATIISFSAVLVAVYLRGAVGHPVRETLTLALGYEARAALEHFASAVACPILVALLFWPFTTETAASPLSPQVPFPTAGRAWLEQPHHLVALAAAGYLQCCFAWEWAQAFVGTCQAPPRGSLQWEQIAADMGGSVVAVLIVRRLCRLRR